MTVCSGPIIIVVWQRPTSSCGVINGYDIIFVNSITGRKYSIRNLNNFLYTITSASPVLNIGARNHLNVQVHIKGPILYIFSVWYIASYNSLTSVYLILIGSCH